MNESIQLGFSLLALFGWVALGFMLIGFIAFGDHLIKRYL